MRGPSRYETGMFVSVSTAESSVTRLTKPGPLGPGRMIGSGVRCSVQALRSTGPDVAKPQVRQEVQRRGRRGRD